MDPRPRIGSSCTPRCRCLRPLRASVNYTTPALRPAWVGPLKVWNLQDRPPAPLRLRLHLPEFSDPASSTCPPSITGHACLPHTPCASMVKPENEIHFERATLTVFIDGKQDPDASIQIRSSLRDHGPTPPATWSPWWRSSGPITPSFNGSWKTLTRPFRFARRRVPRRWFNPERPTPKPWPPRTLYGFLRDSCDVHWRYHDRSGHPDHPHAGRNRRRLAVGTPDRGDLSIWRSCWPHALRTSVSGRSSSSPAHTPIFHNTRLRAVGPARCRMAGP